MAKIKIIKIDLDGEHISVEIRRASTKDGVRRYQMMIAGEEVNKTETDEALMPLRLVTYPAVMCATNQCTGLPWPITFEEYVELPQIVTDPWVEAIYEMNPQWSGRKEPAEETEKKDKASSSESKNT
jgi:hypothetical protein